ncbi:MAG TPA: RICIN domain-containing protein [Ruminiclostridium sp.]
MSKRNFKRVLVLFLQIMLVVISVSTFDLLSVSAAGGTTYYVSSSAGNDSNNGTSSSTPWKTLAKASQAYVAGDSLLLKCGDTWNEELHPTGSGTSASPITIGSYGTGNKPIISRQNQDDTSLFCIHLTDVAGYKITGIEVSNAYRGIYVQYSDGVLGKDYLYIDNCYIHDCNNFNASSYTWGIGLYVTTASNSGQVLSNITVDNSTFERCSDGLDIYKDFSNKSYFFKNVTIKNSKGINGKSCQFCVGQTDTILYDNLYVNNIGVGYFNPGGIAGSWIQNSKNITVQNSEFGFVTRGNGSSDGECFDFEGNNVNATVRNCWFHDSEGCAVLILSNNGDNLNINFDNCVFDNNTINPPPGHPNALLFVTSSTSTGSIKNSKIILRSGVGIGATSNFTVDSTNTITTLMDSTAMYEIVNKNSNKALNVVGDSTADGSNIEQRTYSSGNSQKWQFIYTSNGYYKIKNVNSGKLMDIYHASMDQGTNNIQWSDNGGDNQLWEIIDAGAGYCKIKNKHSGLLLDITGTSTQDGALAIQWTDNGQDNQLWSLVSLSLKDDMNDWSKAYTYSTGLTFDTTSASFFGDSSRVIRTTNDNNMQWIAWPYRANISGATITTYILASNPADISIVTSPSAGLNTWTTRTGTVTDTDIGQGWLKRVYTITGIPAGENYLSVRFPTGGTYNYVPNLGQVIINQP